MDYSTTILIAIGLAADAFAVSMTSGLLIKHIKINKALKIALFFGIFQAIMPIIGYVTGLTFRDLISEIDHWIAFGLLSFIGGKMVYESQQEEGERKKFNPLDFYTLSFLAIATSIDALAAGLGFSLFEVSIVSTASIIGIITFTLSFIGVFLGHYFGNYLNDKVEIAGGIILIGIGIKLLLEGLFWRINS
jgi:putative Mn2+ efflux pump MntP